MKFDKRRVKKAARILRAQGWVINSVNGQHTVSDSNSSNTMDDYGLIMWSLLPVLANQVK